tara:strand:+ start:15 stop:302 length:288 start_codon:yes stop_codon:yes gene_type:complete
MVPIKRIILEPFRQKIIIFFTFSFFCGDTHTHKKTLYKKNLPQEEEEEEGRKRCWDCALPSLARARKDTTTTSARLDARAVAEGALSSSSSSFSV